MNRLWVWCAFCLLSSTSCSKVTSNRDQDGDGVLEVEDCNDLDVAVGAPLRWYPDLDGDGWGLSQSTVYSCSTPALHASVPGDCNDQDSGVHPGAVEICDAHDNDCNGQIDDVDDSTKRWHLDNDGDGYGAPTIVVFQCEAPPHHVANGDDCDDDNSELHPDAPEYCDQRDNDCDGIIDNAYAVDARLWYVDADGDGFGAALSATRSCEPPRL